MRFWLRELLGWVLVLLGLFLFYWDLTLLFADRLVYYLEAMPMFAIAAVVFRGGIHLLKIAVAARMCSYAQTEIKKQEAVKPIGSPAKAEVGADW